MPLDIKGLMYLLTSEHRDDAAFCLTEAAGRISPELEGEVRGAFGRAIYQLDRMDITLKRLGIADDFFSGAGSGRALRDVTWQYERVEETIHQEIQHAFWRLEMFVQYEPQKEKYGGFAHSVETLTALARKMEQSEKAAIALIYTVDREGGRVVDSAWLQQRLKRLLSIMRWIGPRCFENPAKWKATIDHIHRILKPMRRLAFKFKPVEVKEVVVHALLPKLRWDIQECFETFATRTSGRIHDHEREALKTLLDVSAAMIDAYRHERGDELRRLHAQAQQMIDGNIDDAPLQRTLSLLTQKLRYSLSFLRERVSEREYDELLSLVDLRDAMLEAYFEKRTDAMRLLGLTAWMALIDFESIEEARQAENRPGFLGTASREHVELTAALSHGAQCVDAAGKNGDVHAAMPSTALVCSQTFNAALTQLATEAPLTLGGMFSCCPLR